MYPFHLTTELDLIIIAYQFPCISQCLGSEILSCMVSIMTLACFVSSAGGNESPESTAFVHIEGSDFLMGLDEMTVGHRKELVFTGVDSHACTAKTFARTPAVFRR